MKKLTDEREIEQGQIALRALIAESNAKPLTVEMLRAMRGVWPTDESVDEFLEARERWRSEAPERPIP
ncbi:MAG TPA: hypothetical protein VJX67_17755 [Blastocatellia bacterium]|nr:hypothetical protein [Blastocatellia bacterium]